MGRMFLFRTISVHQRTLTIHHHNSNSSTQQNAICIANVIRREEILDKRKSNAFNGHVVRDKKKISAFEFEL